MRLVLTGLLGLVFALGLACGGDDSPSGSTAAPSATSGGAPAASGGGSALQDACTLLDEAQVAAALGDDTVAGMRSEPPTQALSQCQWDGTITGNRYVAISIRTAQNATSVFENSYKSVAGAISVPGIGDEAYALTGQNTPNNYRYLTVAALTSSLYIQVNVAGPERSDEEALSTLTTVLEAVVSNLN